jgi:hypothetical protein
MPYQAVAAIGEEMDKCRRQIDALSFADLFNAITNMRGVQPRNVEEIASRNEEKLTQLGPVIERVANEKLQVAIDRAFAIMSRGAMLPPPPPALHGRAVRVEFVRSCNRCSAWSASARSSAWWALSATWPPRTPTCSTRSISTRRWTNMPGARAPRRGSCARRPMSRHLRDRPCPGRARGAAAAQISQMVPAMKDAAAAAELLSRADVGGESLLKRLIQP